MTKTKIIPDTFGIMAIDPGETTGVAQGFFRVKGGTTRDTLGRAARKGALRVEEIVAAEAYRGGRFDGTIQAALLYRLWQRFQFQSMEWTVPVPYTFLVIENFALRQRSANLAPVRVTEALLGMLCSPSGTWAAAPRLDTALRFQEPSEAMGYARNDRLKNWSVYPLTRGKEHARDALRHLCLGVSHVLDGDWADPVRS